jgi:hypothetical protein
MTQISDPNMKINLIKENNVLYYELELNNGKCKISYESLPKILHIKNDEHHWDFKPKWFLHATGYVMCTIPASKFNASGINLLMHRYLLDELKTNKKVSIDHKNRIRSDNRLENLQLASQSFQNHNQKKKTRKEIDIPGFDKPIKLPEYIGYIKEPTLKEGEKKTGFKSLPAHFLVESKIFGFSKHASKSNKLSIKERLNDALTIRYSLIVDNTDDYELLFIDNKKFKDEKEFEKHNIDLINELCDTQISKITKVDLTAYNITKLSTLASSLTSHGNNTSTTTTKPGEEVDLSYFVFNDEELEELAKLYDEEDKKANNPQPTKDEENYPYNSLEKYLYDIITARKNKTNRSIKNQLDLYIIKKLNDDIPNLNKKAASRILFITDDYIARVLKNEVKLRYNVPITDSFLITSKFMDEYAKIKDEIITEMNSSVTKKLSGLKNIKDIKEKTKTRDWKLSIETIIDMIKDKNNISYREIAQKYKDINGQELTISDVQNVCSSGRSYWLDESDFINRTDISFDEYKTKRETDTIIIPKKKEQPNDAKYLELCKKNSIVKRTCDSSIMVDIFMDKYTILTASKTALKYKNKKGDTVSEALVKQIWSGTTTLFEDDFEGRTDITYQQYLIDVEKDKTTFSRPLEYQKKYDDLIEAVNQKQIISLNRTHIKTLELVGKNKKFINDLKILISNQI